MLIIENLAKSFGKSGVLKSLNVQFEEGLIYGIVGQNGAGKTTFFNCISGLEDCEGKIYHQRYQFLKNHIGYLPTSSYFFPKTTGKEYLEFCTNAKDVQLDINDQVNIFDLPLNKYVENYSTGMKKKLALTGVFIQKNNIYILDEPFNGVDLQSNLVIKNILLDAKKQNKTIIVSSHIMSTLTDICDVIFLLKDKNLIEYSKTEFYQLEKDMMNEYSENKLNIFSDLIH